MHEFKHPKYYKELRARNKSDQAISDSERQAASVKRQASRNNFTKHQASSSKRRNQ